MTAIELELPSVVVEEVIELDELTTLELDSSGSVEVELLPEHPARISTSRAIR
jgi:hypothetical protein